MGKILPDPRTAMHRRKIQIRGVMFKRNKGGITSNKIDNSSYKSWIRQTANHSLVFIARNTGSISEGKHKQISKSRGYEGVDETQWPTETNALLERLEPTK
jgi:hypothetical protein